MGTTWRILVTLAAAVAALQPLVLGSATSTRAQEAPKITQCDLLAANKDDPDRIAPGVSSFPPFQIDVTAAIPACEAALAEQPGIARLQYQYGLALWRAKRYGDAEIWLRKASDQGYPSAQTDLAWVLMNDPRTPPRDRDVGGEILRLRLLAADRGNTVAMGDIGYQYMYGHGVQRDYAEALKWLNRAIEHDDAYAQTHLGEMYVKGWGVPQDDVEAVKWFRLSAKQGYKTAQYCLAVMILAGRGAARDLVAAEDLLLGAAQQESAEATRALEKLRQGLEIEQEPLNNP